MRGRSGTLRTLLTWMALVPLLHGCQSHPGTHAALPPSSSLLALDVVFPVPLGRDPDLVQVFFVRGPIHGGLDELPELIPATFVKWSRAYLLDPEPGTYSVVAVTAAYAPPWNEHRVAGVTQTTWSGTSSDAMIFPEALIQRTRTTVGRGRVEFIGKLQVRRGERIDAGTTFQDDLQRRLAERIRPSVTSKSGLAGWLERTRTIDLEETRLANETADRESFVDAARADLTGSPWADFLAAAAPPEVGRSRASTRTPATKPVGEIREAAATPPPAPPLTQASIEPPPSLSQTKAASEEPATRISEPMPTAEPDAEPEELASLPPEPVAPTGSPTSRSAGPPPPSPAPRSFPGLPPDSPLVEIESGMSHHEVREILGDPDDRVDRLTTKAWIPFYMGPGANLRDWIYTGMGRVVFTLYRSRLEVVDVIYDPDVGR